MGWALWLLVPVGATALTAVWAWVVERRARPNRRRLGTPDSMQAHREYLDALSVPARSTHRVDPREPSD